MGAFVSPWPALVPEGHAGEVYAIATVPGGWAEGRVRAPARLAGEAQRPSSSRSVTSRPTCVTKAVNGPTDWAQDQWGG